MLSGSTFRSLASCFLIWSDLLGVHAGDLDAQAAVAELLDDRVVAGGRPRRSSSAWSTETLVFWVVKTAPPWNSMPMFRPRTARPTIAVMVIRIEMPYQSLRLPMKS